MKSSDPRGAGSRGLLGRLRYVNAIGPGQFDVVRDNPPEGLEILLRQVTQLLRRIAGPQFAPAHDLARRHAGPARHHGAAFHHRAVQDGGVHANEGIVLDLAGMQQRHVSDRDVAAARGAKTARGDMDDRPVLQVGVLADADAGSVAAQHRTAYSVAYDPPPPSTSLRA